MLFEIIEGLAAIAALYLVASPRIAERAYHSNLFDPWKYPKGNYDFALAKSSICEDIFFPSLTGKQLHGWYFQGSPGQKTILLCHGKTGNISDLQILIELLCQTGASVFAFDYQGYGKSEGGPSVKGICDDGSAAYKWLVDHRKIAPTNIIVYGESLGGAVACHLAKHSVIGGLILQSAFSSLRKISIENLPALQVFPETLFPPPFWNNISVLKDYSGPVLLIHGQLDDHIKISHAEEMHIACKEPKHFARLPNTLHDEISELDSQQFLDSIKMFLSTTTQTIPGAVMSSVKHS